MGLAASQARLLTITSRMSSVELRQQRIAMDKMRLANDQDEVVEKYTNALNNKTLSISNGAQEVPMTYEALKSHGYQVAKASEASSISTVTAPRQTTTIVSSTPTSSNVTQPKSVSKPIYTLEDVQSYIDDVGHTSVEDCVWDYSSNKAYKASEIATTSNSAINNLYNQLFSALDEIVAVGGYEYIGRQVGAIPSDWFKNPNDAHANYKGFVKEKRNLWSSKVVPLANQLATEMRNAGMEVLAKKMGYMFDSENKLNEYNFGDGSTYTEKVFSAWNGNKANVFDDSVPSYLKPGEVSDEEYYAGSYVDCGRINSISVQVKNTLNTFKNLGNHVSLEDQSNWTKEQQLDYKTLTEGYKIYEEKWNEYNNYNKAVASAGSTSSTSASPSVSSSPVISTGSYSSSSYVPSKDLEDQLKNSQFLIQGLLSGYLVLMKDGQQVSLSSATDIIESYDKSDDAAAEAEYNAQMSKINRKEKMLDMQAKRLDTEYSALTTEYDSVKNLIQNHTQKDFSYFS